MSIVLIHSMNGNEVHGADNDKRTGCGIRYSSPENHIKYSRQGEMKDINDITCPKCKEVLAKKLIRSSNKEFAISAKEERKKFARAKKMGMVSEATFEEYQMNKEAEFAEEMARRQMQESMQKPSYMQNAPRQTFDEVPEPFAAAPVVSTVPEPVTSIPNNYIQPQDEVEEDDDDGSVRPNFIEYVPPTKSSRAERAKTVESVIPKPQNVLSDVDDVLSQFIVKKQPEPEYEEPKFTQKKPPVIDDVLSQFMFKPATNDDESVSPAPPPVVRQQHPAEIDTISPIPVQNINSGESLANNQDMIDLVRQTVMSENTYNEPAKAHNEPIDIRKSEPVSPPPIERPASSIVTPPVQPVQQSRPQYGEFMSVTPPSPPQNEEEYARTAPQYAAKEEEYARTASTYAAKEEEIHVSQPQIQYSQYTAPAAAVNETPKAQVNIISESSTVIEDVESVLNQFSNAGGQFQRNHTQQVMYPNAAPAPVPTVTPIFANQPTKRQAAPAFLTPKTSIPMVDSIEDALDQLGASVQHKEDGTEISKKDEKIPEFVEYVAPPKEKRTSSYSNPYSAPAPPPPMPVTSPKEAKRLAKLNEMFQKNLIENGYVYGQEHKSKRRGK